MPRGYYPGNKGRIPWNKGKPHTTGPETWKKISAAAKGRKHSQVTKDKIAKSHLGIRPSEETKRRISEVKKGTPAWNKGKEYLQIRGENHPNWRGGVTPINEQIRKSIEYKEWRRAVFARDNYSCVDCGQLRGRIEADHIKTFAEYPELRFDIDNGRTLCHDCHRRTETYGFRKKQAVR